MDTFAVRNEYSMVCVAVLAGLVVCLMGIPMVTEQIRAQAWGRALVGLAVVIAIAVLVFVGTSQWGGLR